jgi:glucokinase
VRFGEEYVRRIEKAMLPHLFSDQHPPAMRLAALGDLGGAIGASLLVARAARKPAAREAATTSS